MKKITRAFFTLSTVLLLFYTSNTLASEWYLPKWWFANTSFNYLDWSKGTERRTADNAAKGDFAYLELEWGAGFKWGEFYSFFDLENPTHGTHESDGRDYIRSAFKLTSHIYMGTLPTSLYLHIYDFRDYGYKTREQDLIFGIGYPKTFSDGSWFKPFAAFAYTNSDKFDGMNGYMLGLSGGYNFTLFKQKFSLTDWHEFTFARKDEYLRENYVNGKAGKVGNNGALALWWYPYKRITMGVQYRYSMNKLGTPKEYQNAIIYTVKFNFH